MNRNIILTFILFLSLKTFAQSNYVVPGTKHDWFLNRMEVKFPTNYLRFSSLKPFNRKSAVRDIEQIDSLNKDLSSVDKYNIESFLMSNNEWSTPRVSFISNKPILKYFYKSKANALEVQSDDYYFVFNPIIQYQQYKEKNNSENVYLNSRGLEARGIIQDKIGFSFYFTENQERPPAYASNWINKSQAVPGMGYYKHFLNSNTAYDYFDIRSSVSWKVAKWMDMQLAYDKNFIGNGYRSLFLSDFSGKYMFLKLNWHFKKFQYQNIFAELISSYIFGTDKILPRKYYRANYLNYAATNWLNIGLFEGTIMGKDKLTIGLFNPVIFTNIPGEDGIKSRSYIGMDVKANLYQHLQLYGQLMIDKLKTNDLSNKTWNNRLGYQLGLKYIDAFGLKNLDIQLESNRVRPYTYAASDSLTSYTHYNQPLAHPLGANFQEFIGVVRAQPLKQVYLEAKIISYYQGLDKSSYNFGSNPFNGFSNRLTNEGINIGDGNKADCLLMSFVASYELKQNLFIDASFNTRSYETQTTPKTTSTFASIGVRWNMARRTFDF